MIMKEITSIFILLLAVVTLSAQDIVGDWNAKLSLDNGMGQKVTYRLVLHVTATDDGYASTMDSPDQNQFGIPTDTTFLIGKQFTFELDAAQLVYEGELVDDNNIKGNLTQFGQSFELDLKKETE